MGFRTRRRHHGDLKQVAQTESSFVNSPGGLSVLALVARLGDLAVRHAAAQALNRIGLGAKAAVPALLIAMKSEDRLFRESVVMALRKIDPGAAASMTGNHLARPYGFQEASGTNRPAKGTA